LRIETIRETRDEKRETIQETRDEKQETRKVFESIQINDSPLFKKVESQLVDKLANSISLYQSIHFTKELFHNNSERFQQFIQFIDDAATANNWEQEISTHFPEILQTSDPKALTDLLLLVEKKFN